MTIAVTVLFALAGLLCLVAVIAGLPGTWILLALAFALELLDVYWLQTRPAVTFGWWVLGIGLLMAAIGEAIELASSVFGSKAGGASKRGMFGAIAGGILGGLAGTVFLPIPIVGTLVGALLGTFAGAMWGEMTGPERRKQARDAIRPALAATVARALGTVAKAGVGAVVWILLCVAAFWRLVG
jgi:uncharacterized protein YqgC (DUF456 family)